MDKDIEFIASGYPSIDYIVQLRDTPQLGRTSIIQNKEHQNPFFGGCNVNIAYLCSVMGHRTRLSMRVGNDFISSGFKSFLEEGGINTSNLQCIEEDVTSTSQLIMNEEGNHITLFYPGAMNEKYPVGINEDLIKQSRYGVITVGDPQYNLRFAECCIKHEVPLVFGMKCDFEAFTPEHLMTIMQHSELIFMNESEQAVLEECLPIESVLDFILDGITKCIIVTLGSKGSKIFYKTGNSILEEVIPVAKPKWITDTTGVGDAYIAGFLHGYINDKSIRQCGQSGSVMASFIIEEHGCLTNKPSRAEFYSRYKENYQEEL